MEIRPIFSSLLRNKTGALLIAAQVALSLAIALPVWWIWRRLRRGWRQSSTG